MQELEVDHWFDYGTFYVVIVFGNIKFVNTIINTYHKCICSFWSEMINSICCIIFVLSRRMWCQRSAWRIMGSTMSSTSAGHALSQNSFPRPTSIGYRYEITTARRSSHGSMRRLSSLVSVSSEKSTKLTPPLFSLNKKEKYFHIFEIVI